MIRTVLLFTIRVDAGWAIGAPDRSDPIVDRDLLTDPDGRPWIPASSLAGSLRDHLRGHGQDERLMGPAPGTAKLSPSALWLLGTRIRAASGSASEPESAPEDGGEVREPRTAVASATAIDPTRRAARPKSLRHSRLVDEDCLVELYAVHDGDLTVTDLRLLAEWQPQVGRDRTRGGGRARLEALGYRRYDMAGDGLHAWLTESATGRFSDLAPVEITAVPDEPVLDVVFTLRGALHIGIGSPPPGEPAGIRTRGDRPIIPASTWKGLFRGRVGYILRTLDGEEAACTCQVGCGACRLCDLFGSTGRRGRLAFQDATIESAPTPRTREHVAIDRITGGSLDKHKYDWTVITSGRVRLTIRALDTPINDADRTLLLHVVRDLDDGLIGVGGGSQRGSGTLAVHDNSRHLLDTITAIGSPA